MSSLCSQSEFMRLTVAAVAMASAEVRKIRLDNEVIRKMRLLMVITVQTKACLPEALAVMMHAIATRAKSRNVRYADVVELFTRPALDDSDSEAEWEPEASLAAKPLWQVRKVLDCFERDGKKYYLVDWQPTEEPRENIPLNLIAAFTNERRAIVRRALYEDEAVETK